MAEKRNPGRFTIQFSSGDPKQTQAAALLAQQGRHKAQFITSAILHYIHCSEISESNEQPVVDRSVLEQLVLEILERHGKEVPQQTPENTPLETATRLNDTAAVPSDLEQFFGESGIAAIASTLSAFQQG